MSRRPFNINDPVHGMPTTNGLNMTLTPGARIIDAYWCKKRKDWICLISHNGKGSTREFKKIILEK